MKFSHSSKSRRAGGDSPAAAHNSLVQVEMNQVEMPIPGQPKSYTPKNLGAH